MKSRERQVTWVNLRLLLNSLNVNILRQGDSYRLEIHSQNLIESSLACSRVEY